MNTVKVRVVGRRTSWRLAAMVAVVGLLGFAPVSATASDEVGEPEGIIQLFSESQCVSGNFCVWSAASYSGTFGKATSTSPASTGFSTGMSVWNRSSKAARVYSGTGGTGSWVCYTPSTKISSTSVPARSVALLSGSTC